MSPIDAVKTCLSKYAVFNGRARRSEYWWFILFYVVVMAVIGSIGGGINGASGSSDGPGIAGNFVIGVVELALFLPLLGATIRRFHDTGRSGWWVLIGLIPCVGSIIQIVLLVQDSVADNQYGPNPKG